MTGLTSSSSFAELTLSEALEEHFGSYYRLHVFPELIYFLRQFAGDLPLGFTHHRGSRGGFFLVPRDTEPQRVRSPNGRVAWMTPQSLGVLSALYAYGSLSYSNSAGLCLMGSNQTQDLKRSFLEHPEWPVIHSLMSS